MSAAEVLQQLRRFLLLFSVLLFIGALTELWLVGHTEDVLQWVPFVLSTLASIAVLAALLHPSRVTVRILRMVMGVVVAGTLLGIYLHVEGNVTFEQEIDPNATTRKLIWSGLSGGNPLLAPGVLAVAAVLALSATYRYQVGSKCS